MRKVYRVEDLDCANCALKIEKGIAALPGVTYACLNFISGRLTVEAAEEEMEAVMKEVAKVCRRVDPGCRIING